MKEERDAGTESSILKDWQTAGEGKDEMCAEG